MKSGEFGYRGKTALIVGMGAALTAGTEAAVYIGGAEQAGMLDTANWLGKVGLIWGGVRVAMLGVGKLADSAARQEFAVRQQVMSELPTFETPVSPLRIMANVRRHDEERGRTSKLGMSFFSTNYALRSGIPEGHPLAYSSLHSDVQRAINDTADAFRSGDDIDDAPLMMARMAWLLDKAAPIAVDCPKTPQTADTGRFWYDYMLSEASQRAELQAAA
jgi:hypothetical protein